jgi:nucleoside diphosphate kinase
LCNNKFTLTIFAFEKCGLKILGNKMITLLRDQRIIQHYIQQNVFSKLIAINDLIKQVKE